MKLHSAISVTPNNFVGAVARTIRRNAHLELLARIIERESVLYFRAYIFFFVMGGDNYRDGRRNLGAADRPSEHSAQREYDDGISEVGVDDESDRRKKDDLDSH